MQLENIFGLTKGDARRCLMDMHSVVNIGRDDQAISIYHKSFSDFLLDASRSKEFNTSIEDDMHDRVYLNVIRNCPYRDTIRQILGQVTNARSMPSEVDFFGTPANSLSPKRLTSIFILGPYQLNEAIAHISSMLEVGDEDQDIRIRHTPFLDFLLDRSRSQELFVDINEARLTLRQAPIRSIFMTEGTSN